MEIGACVQRATPVDPVLVLGFGELGRVERGLDLQVVVAGGGVRLSGANVTDRNKLTV